MNSLSWLIYLANVTGSLSGFLTFLSVIMGIAAAVLFIAGVFHLDERPSYREIRGDELERYRKRKKNCFKASAVFFFALMFMGTVASLMPNRQTVLLIAACGDEWTPLFEWCSRKQRIVVDYPEDRLVFLAMRNNFSGNYLDRRGLEALSKLWDLDLVKVHELDWSGNDSDQLKDLVRSMQGIEGFIVQFYDGHMIKIKTDEYVALHRAKALLDNERDVVGLILDEKTDDLLPLLPQSERARLRKFEADVWGDILRFQTGINLTLRKLVGVTRKEFALASSNMDPIVRSTVFRFFEDGTCDLGYIVDLVRKNLGSRAAYAKLQIILKTASWKESNNDE